MSGRVLGKQTFQEVAKTGGVEPATNGADLQLLDECEKER